MYRQALRKIFLLMSVFLISLTGIQYAAYAQEARIVYVEGQAQVLRSGSTRWTRARKNMTLSRGDKVRAEADSSCEIAFDRELNSVTKVDADTVITITRIEPAKIYMPKGRVLSCIEKLPEGSSFEVRTPSIVAGVKGTTWGVERGSPDAVFVSDGRVNVTTFDGERFLVSRGEELIQSMVEGRMAARMADISSDHRDRLNSWRDRVTRLIEKEREALPPPKADEVVKREVIEDAGKKLESDLERRQDRLEVPTEKGAGMQRVGEPAPTEVDHRK